MREARKIAQEQPQLLAWVISQWAASTAVAKPGQKGRAGQTGTRAPLRGLDAIAVLVTTLGEGAAVLAFRLIEPKTRIELGLSVYRQAIVSRQRQYEVLRDFLDLANQQVVLVGDPLAFTRAALERAVGARQAERVQAAVAARSSRTLDELLQSLSLDVLADCVRKEPPQVAAALLGLFESQRVAELCLVLDESLGRDLVSRLAQVRPLASNALRQLHEGLVRALADTTSAESPSRPRPIV